MEHEVFVPVAVEVLRRALADLTRVARAVPGLQQDAGDEPVSGRIKVRVGNTSITYRGALKVAERDDGTYAIEGDATEARGSGTVSVALTLRLVAADGGTTFAFGGGVTGDGRFAELEPGARGTAGRRLLNRFAKTLGEADGAPEDGGAGQDAPQDDAGVAPATPGPLVPTVSTPAEGNPPPGPAPERPQPADRAPADPHPRHGAADVPQGPPAEAAHARRTMIGRSAEEVDHAPPRGRYAPVPAPEGGTASVALRWAAPAAVFVLASAIVIGRALRRRR